METNLLFLQHHLQILFCFFLLAQEQIRSLSLFRRVLSQEVAILIDALDLLLQVLDFFQEVFLVVVKLGESRLGSFRCEVCNLISHVINLAIALLDLALRCFERVFPSRDLAIFPVNHFRRRAP